MGATDLRRPTGTRKDFGTSIEFNATMGPTPETAAFELGYFSAHGTVTTATNN
jgi:hypothetical protein